MLQQQLKDAQASVGQVGEVSINGDTPAKLKPLENGTPSVNEQISEALEAKPKKKQEQQKNLQASLVNVQNSRKTEEKSEAEKAKDARAAEIRQQLKIFANVYPELVEKHSIKYPIED